MSCEFDNGVVLFYAVHELPDGLKLKWCGTTTYQKLVKGRLFSWIISMDNSMLDRGQVQLNILMTIQTSKGVMTRKWSIMCYTHVLPIRSLSTAGYINLISKSVGLRPFDLYSRVRQIKSTGDDTDLSLQPAPYSDKTQVGHTSTGDPETNTQGDSGSLKQDWVPSANVPYEPDTYDNNSYDDYWGFNSMESDDDSGSSGSTQSGLISDVGQEDSKFSHEQDVQDSDAWSHESTSSYGRTDTTIWASDAYSYMGVEFSSPIDYEIGVKSDGDRVIVDNPYDDPVVQDYIQDKYMEQYQQDVDEYDNNSSDDDPYADWSDSWDAWEL